MNQNPSGCPAAHSSNSCLLSPECATFTAASDLVGVWIDGFGLGVRMKPSLGHTTAVFIVLVWRKIDGDLKKAVLCGRRMPRTGHRRRLVRRGVCP